MIEWLGSFSEASARAKETKQPIFVDFFSPG